MLMSAGNHESQAGCEMSVSQVLSVIRRKKKQFIIFSSLHCRHLTIKYMVEKIEKKALVLAILLCHQELSI